MGASAPSGFFVRGKMPGPRLIHQSYSTFGDAEYSVDPMVVKRIRTEFDRFFCPLFTLKVYQWEDGHTKKFKIFGVGASSKEDLPIQGHIYSAARPTYGYLSKIEPASQEVVWWPYDNRYDGTPGDTIPFGDNIYYLVKRTFERTKELEYVARQIEKTQALTYSKEFTRQEKEKEDKVFDYEKSEAAYRLKQEIPVIRRLNDTTSEDVEKMQDKALRAQKPFVHLGA